MIELNFDPPKPVKCKHCGKDKGKHKAGTHNCPFNEVRRGHPSFRADVFFEPKEKKNAR